MIKPKVVIDWFSVFWVSVFVVFIVVVVVVLWAIGSVWSSIYQEGKRMFKEGRSGNRRGGLLG